MAKISARGARESAKSAATSVTGDRHLFVLRSDGTVLSRLADKALGNTGYTIAGKIPLADSARYGAKAALANYIVGCGYKVTS